MITDQTHVKAGTPKTLPPIKLAALCYQKNQKSGTDFIDDLSDHLANGVVIARPDIFGMAKIIDLAPLGATEPEPAWFVRMAVGELGRLLRALPCYLPKICFCRRNDGRLRVYDTARLFNRVVKKEEEKD